MNKYLNYEELTLSDFSEDSITDKYSLGFVFTRKNKGVMYQTRSLRINLTNFEFNSENRRVLNKNNNLILKYSELPIPLEKYDWRIHALGGKYYSTKFGDNTFSVSKIKELLTSNESNFNINLIYFLQNTINPNPLNESILGTNYNTVMHNINESIKDPIGYCICYQNSKLLHYSYPFYNLEESNNLGMGMMLKAIDYSKQLNHEYIYLGSVSSLESKYKLQFNNLEWWDNSNKKWNSDLNELKDIINLENSSN